MQEIDFNDIDIDINKLVSQQSKNVEQRNIVKEIENSTLDNIKDSEDFKKQANNLYMQKSLADFESEALVIKNQELDNEYEKYKLEKKKELLNRKIKFEKSLIKERVKAEIKEEKRKIALKRYGYLTPLLNEKGEVIRDEQGNIQIDYSKFTPNKFSNVIKEFEYNYNNLNKSTRKLIWGTIKTILLIGAISLVGYLIYLGGSWLFPLLQQVKGV